MCVGREGGRERERESAAQPQARLTVAELGAARCRQTRLLLSSFIPRERYLCAEHGSVHVDTDKVSRQIHTLTKPKINLLFICAKKTTASYT